MAPNSQWELEISDLSSARRKRHSFHSDSCCSGVLLQVGCHYTHDGEEKYEEYDTVLLAIGRTGALPPSIVSDTL